MFSQEIMNFDSKSNSVVSPSDGKSYPTHIIYLHMPVILPIVQCLPATYSAYNNYAYSGTFFLHYSQGHMSMHIVICQQVALRKRNQRLHYCTCSHTNSSHSPSHYCA